MKYAMKNKQSSLKASQEPLTSALTQPFCSCGGVMDEVGCHT